MNLQLSSIKKVHVKHQLAYSISTCIIVCLQHGQTKQSNAEKSDDFGFDHQAETYLMSVKPIQVMA